MRYLPNLTLKCPPDHPLLVGFYPFSSSCFNVRTGVRGVRMRGAGSLQGRQLPYVRFLLPRRMRTPQYFHVVRLSLARPAIAYQ